MPRKQPSSIDLRLPEDIREKFNEMLNDPRMTGLEITARINELLEAAGSPERVFKSSVYRKISRMERIGARLKQSREVAKVWIGKLGAEPQGEVGKLLNEMVRNLAFEATMDMAEGDEPVAPKLIKDMAIAIHRLEQAAEKNAKVEEQIRKQTLEDAADRVEEAAVQMGQNKEQAEFWRKRGARHGGHVDGFTR